MGKRYYCDYCDKIMVASPSIIRTHNSGLLHQQLVREHYQQYKDIETIYSEESLKKPCARFATGTCKFDLVCHYSHYTKEQMQQFREYLDAKNKSLVNTLQPSFEELYKKLQDNKSTERQEKRDHTILLDPNGVTHILPWTYKGDSDSQNITPWTNKGDSDSHNITPSLKRLQFECFENAHIVEWGTIH